MGWQRRVKRARRYLMALNTRGAQKPNVTPPACDAVAIRHVVLKARLKALGTFKPAPIVGLEATYLHGRRQSKTRAVKRAQVKVRQQVQAQRRTQGRGGA